MTTLAEVPAWNVFAGACPTRMLLDRIADKWTVLTVIALAHEAKHFGGLKRELAGISQKMLTQTLRSLERDGIIERKVIPCRPPRVEYSLTELGATLVALVESIRHWSEGPIVEVLAARERFDLANP